MCSIWIISAISSFWSEVLGCMICSAACHQGTIYMFWLHFFWGRVVGAYPSLQSVSGANGMCDTLQPLALVSRCSYFSTVVWMRALRCLTWVWNTHSVCSHKGWSCQTRWERGWSPSCVDPKLNSRSPSLSWLSLVLFDVTYECLLDLHHNVHNVKSHFQFGLIYRLIRFRSAFHGGRKKQQRSRQRRRAPPRCDQRIKTTWRSKLRRVFLLTVSFASTPSLSPIIPAVAFNFKLLACCRSLSVSSEESSPEKEKTEEKEVGAQKGSTSLAEEPVAATPPAVREVPAHLQRQVVRHLRQSSFWLFQLPFPL